jgi:hypothetical protein
MQTNPTQTPDERLTDAERHVLYLLTTPEDGQPIWSVEDIGREIESADDAEIAVNGLLRAGLTHKTSDGFVSAARVAVRVVQMVGQVV